MDIQEKLRRVRGIDRIIIANKKLVDDLENMKDFIQNDTTRDTFENTAEIAKQQEIILKTIARDQAEMTEALRLINMLDMPLHRTLLTEHYINGKPWEVIAEEVGYSGAHTRRMSGEAIRELEEKLKE